MKKIIAGIAIAIIMAGTSAVSYASDWDKAGKALAIIEGARVLTGGNVDIIGNLTGINRNNRSYGSGTGNRGHIYTKKYTCAPQPVWVPHYVWRKQYVPEHEECDNRYGTVIVEAHYIRYKAADGGHWE